MAEVNALYFGDNLDVLRRYIADETVDLIYLDPPFKSDATYNVLFAEKNGSQAAAQIKAFEDSWHWDQTAAAAYQEVVERGGPVSLVVQAFRTFLGCNDMLAYLSMLAIRMIELHRVLKPTGSLYLHCDPTASHYLKLLLDAVFWVRHFRTEIIWKRTSAHSDTKQGRKQHGRIHDVIFFYTKGDTWTWNPIYLPYDQHYIDQFYRYIEPGTGRRYRLDNLTAAKPGGETDYQWRIKRPSHGGDWETDFEDEWKKPRPDWEYRGVKPYKRRFWAYSKANMLQFAQEGRIVYTSNGTPCYKRYLDEMPGVPLQDVWTDIKPVGSRARERLGYPTQKPEALLERIIQTSSNEGDLVLDPFCGCGTTIAVAHRMNRRWIGIDITHLAINLMRVRLHDTFGLDMEKDYRVIGEPTTVADAEALAKQDPYQFQFWALGLVGARPTDPKRGADKGIDGRLYFHDEGPSGKTKQVIISIKSGKVHVSHVRDLLGVVQRERAAIGVLISLEEPTANMRTEAAAAGFYKSPGGTQHPKIQLLTIRTLLEEGKRIDLPPAGWAVNCTFKRAPRAKQTKNLSQNELDFGEEA